MARILGRTVDVGIAFEATPGTEVAPTYWIPKLDMDFQDNPEFLQNESSLGNLVKYNDVSLFRLSGAGSISGKVMDENFGMILRAFMGQAPVTAPIFGGPVTEHTFSMSNSSEQDTFTLTTEDENSTLFYANAVMESLEITLSNEDYAKFSASFLSQAGEVWGTAPVPAYTVETEFLPQHTTVFIEDDTVPINPNASPELKVLSATITLTKNIIPNYEIGDITPAGFFTSSVEIAGTFELYYEDDTHRQTILNNQKKRLRFNLTNTDKTIGATSNPEFYVDLFNVALSSRSLSGGNDDLRTESVGFTGLWSVAEAKAIEFYLKNLATAGY